VVDPDPVDLDADQVGVDVEQRRDREAAPPEAAVAGQRVAEVADPDERDGLAVGEPEGVLQVPEQPTYDRSLRSLAEFTPLTAASSSLDTVSVPCSASSPSMRRYTARRATVASGTARCIAVPAPPSGAPSGPVRDGAAGGRAVTLASPRMLENGGGRGRVPAETARGWRRSEGVDGDAPPR
jgi:hypothetical protein